MSGKPFTTVSKDEIHLVWKVSSVGEMLTLETGDGSDRQEAVVGHNSPFEEFAVAQELIEKKISCVHPRAIYMAGLRSPNALDYITDLSCYERHEGLQTPEGKTLLKPDHNYLTVWGFWRTVNPDSDGTRPGSFRWGKSAKCSGARIDSPFRGRGTD